MQPPDSRWEGAKLAERNPGWEDSPGCQRLRLASRTWLQRRLLMCGSFVFSLMATVVGWMVFSKSSRLPGTLESHWLANGAFVDEIILDLGVAPKSGGCVLIRRGAGPETEGRLLCEDRGRDWRDVAGSLEPPGVTGRSKGQGWILL